MFGCHVLRLAEELFEDEPCEYLIYSDSELSSGSLTVSLRAFELGQHADDLVAMQGAVIRPSTAASSHHVSGF